MKSILVLFIVICSLSAKSQTLSPRFEVAYLTSTYKTMNRGAAEVYHNEIYLLGPRRVNAEMVNDYGNFMFKTGLVFKYKNFELSNDATVFCRKTNFTESSFTPNLAIWDFKASYTIEKIKISFMHQCIHTVKNSTETNSDTFGGLEGFSISYGY